MSRNGVKQYNNNKLQCLVFIIFHFKTCQTCKAENHYLNIRVSCEVLRTRLHPLYYSLLNVGLKTSTQSKTLYTQTHYSWYK